MKEKEIIKMWERRMEVKRELGKFGEIGKEERNGENVDGVLEKVFEKEEWKIENIKNGEIGKIIERMRGIIWGGEGWEEKMFLKGRERKIDEEMDGMDKWRKGERMKEESGEKNGYEEDDEEEWVKCFMWDLLEEGKRYGDEEIGGEEVLREYWIKYLCNNEEWKRVDRRIEGGGDGEKIESESEEELEREKDDEGEGRGGIESRDDGWEMS